MPIGSTFDTAKGRVNLVAAANNSGKTQRAWFYEGVFKLAQTKGSKPLTTLKLTGKLSCGRSSSATAAAKKKRSVVYGATARASSGPRALQLGDRTRHPVAHRGPLQRDADEGQAGTVTVRDFAKKRNVTVRAGKQYFARKK